MKKNVVLCIDHQIGFEIIDMIEGCTSDYYSVVKIVTTRGNDQGFWQPVASILNNEKFTICDNTNDLESALEEVESRIDYIFLLSWKFIVSRKVLSFAEIGVLNLHYSLLPKYRGVYPVNNAIINGENSTGVSFHWVTEGIDNGAVILQAKENIKEVDTAYTLLERLDKVALLMFKQIWFSSRNLQLLPEANLLKKTHDENYFSRGFYDQNNLIDLSQKFTAREFVDLCRGKVFKDKTTLFFYGDDGKKVFIKLELVKEE